MNREERDVIDGIFKRLEQAANQPRDREAEAVIAEKLRAQPYAPYAMAQLVYVQEEAIKSLNAQLEQTRAQAQQAQPEQSGGFLSSIFGGGSRQAPPQQGRPGGAWGAPQGGGYAQPQPGYAPAPQQGGPWGGGGGGYAPQAQQAPGRGSGFLGGALTTAAGVAGGMVVGNALMNAFSGGHHALGGLGGGANPFGASGETVVENNYFGSDQAGASSDFGSPLYGDGNDGGLQDASFDGDDGGSDLGGGGGDDWV